MSFRLMSCSFIVLTSIVSAAQADCKSDIQDILKSMEASAPYRMEMTTTSGGTDTKMIAEVIMPHSMRMKGEGMEVTMTANGVWMSQGGTMNKMPNEMKDQIQGMIRQGMNAGMQAVEAAECIGSTDFEGGSFSLYKYKADAEFMGIKTTSKVDMYVNGDGKPEWLVVDGEAMGIKSLTKQHIVFDDSITIADPK
jgi:hypothetical protein